MKSSAIRQKLHQFIDTAEEKKVRAIFTLLEDEITHGEWDYTGEFKKELDRRYIHYKSGGEMVSAADAKKQIGKLLKQVSRNEAQDPKQRK